MAEEKKETTLFEDLARITSQQEQEDLETLKESEEELPYKTPEQREEEAINKTMVDFIDDGKLDYDAKSSINFNIGHIAEHFGLKPEELNRFSEIYEKQYRLLLSQAVYNKSIQDQLKQKTDKVKIDKAVQDWQSMLNKILDLEMLEFLCNLSSLTDDVKKQIIAKEVDKFFGSQPTTSPKRDITQTEILGQLQSISHILRKRA
jgi:hypothetical protein